MKRFCIFAIAALAFLRLPAQAEPRLYDAPTLEALAAPVALYPDTLLSNVLAATQAPRDVADAAGRPEIYDSAWSPAVQALVPFPEVLQRMAESPQWMADIGWAAQMQRPALMLAVQILRQRAYAAGTLQSNDYQRVVVSGQAIAVSPLTVGYIFLPYYDPYVVYGAWRPAVRPTYWRPWPARHVRVEQERRERNGAPSPAARIQATQPQIGTRGNGDPSPARQLQLEQQEKFQQRQQQPQKLNFAPHRAEQHAQRQQQHHHG
jgi:uncharacterized protein DUF3300